MESKSYTEEEVQRLINRQRFVTTFENLFERFAPQMSKTEYETCVSILQMLTGAGTQPPAGTDKEPVAAAATAGGDTGEKYPD